MLISKSEFARRIGVSPVAVGKAVKSGRLTLLEGRWLDEKVAALQWDLNRKRLPPAPKSTRVTQADPDETTSPPINWLVENSGLWIALAFHLEALPRAAQNWLALAADGPVSPELSQKFLELLQEIGACVGRIRNPEPDE